MNRRKRDRRALARAAAAPATAAADGSREPGRIPAQRKTESILRLLRGESLDTLAREPGVTAATLAQRREAFLAGGPAALKSRPADERDDELQRPSSGSSSAPRPTASCSSGRTPGAPRARAATSTC